MTKEKFLYGEIKIKPVLNALVLKYIAVICLCLSQIARCLQIYLALNRSELFEIENQILDVILKACAETSKITVPLMLAWMASQIFSNKEAMLKWVLFYGVVAALYYGGEIAFFLLYFIPKVNLLAESLVGFTLDPEMIKVMGGYFSNFNVFIDLFLCCCVCYFVMGRPKKIKSKRGLVLFRLCVIFPLAYITASFVLSGLIKNGVLSVNIYTGSLLPRRGLVNFFIFSCIMTFIAFRERLYNRFNTNGVTYAEYEKTNRYRINYAVVASLIFIIISVADTLFGLIPGADVFGIGNSLTLMLAVPFLLLHDFTAKPKSRIWSGLIAPIYAISYLILFVMYLNLFSSMLKILIDIFSAV